MWRSGAKVCPSNKIWDRECGGIWAAAAKSVTIQKLVQGNLELLILEFRTWSQSWCLGLGQKLPQLGHRFALLRFLNQKFDWCCPDLGLGPNPDIHWYLSRWQKSTSSAAGWPVVGWNLAGAVTSDGNTESISKRNIRSCGREIRNIIVGSTRVCRNVEFSRCSSRTLMVPSPESHRGNNSQSQTCYNPQWFRKFEICNKSELTIICWAVEIKMAVLCWWWWPKLKTNSGCV